MTDLRQRPTFRVNTNNILGVPVTSDEPENNASLVYNNTSGYYEMRNIVTGGGANIFSNKTFTGEFKVGANGTPLHEMRHFSTSISGPLNPNQSTTTNIAISPAFSGVPNIQIIATSDTGANPNNDAALTVIVNEL